MMKITKKTQLLAATMTMLTATGLAFADDNTPTPPSDSHGVVNAIQQLGNQIESLTKAGVKSVNELAYKIDQSFPLSMQLNIKQADIQDSTRAQAQVETNRAVKRSLQPFSAGTLTYTNQSQPEVQKVNAETKARQNYMNQLKNLDASDTIYSLVQGMDVSTYWTKKNIGVPGANDGAFDFGALIEPEAYTLEQMKNSENFIGYATRQYQSYADAVNLSTLKNALVQYQKQGVKTLSQQINQFRSNSAYQNYQLSIRSLTATNSVATDILSGLAAERKPILKADFDPQLDAISRAIGIDPQSVSVKNANGDTVTMYRYASPMQIAKYRANYRLNTPQWYQEVAGDSAENLQRKSVVLLAEISSQLYQNHLDNEKMLGALAILNLQMSNATEGTLKTQVKDLNDAIAGFAAGASATTQPQTTTTSSTSYNTSSVDTSSYYTNGANTTTTSTPSQ